MAVVSGPLADVTTAPTSARQVWVHAAGLRTHGGGLVTTEPHRVAVDAGQVEFSASPGPVVMVIVHAGGVPEKVALLVPEEDVSLSVAALAAESADVETLSALEQLGLEMAAALAKAEAAAASATIARDEAVAAGLVWRGEWDPTLEYEPGDAVGYLGSSWRAEVVSTGVVPEDGPSWIKIAQGGQVLEQIDYLPDGTPFLLDVPAIGYPDPDLAGILLPDRLSLANMDARYAKLAALETGRLSEAALNATYGSRSGARAVGQGELTFSATDFGAVGDGITNDTAAIQACIEAALAVIGASTGKATVTLPRGTYLVDHNLFYNVARPSGGNLTHGLTFVGDGRRSTILKLQTNGVESWFYDNMSTDTQRMAGLMFYGIGFDTDDYELGNGFKLVSKGHEKRFWFFECRFNLGTIMQTEGTGNGDLNRFFNCELYANRAWLILNNSQSVNHIFSNCLMHTLRDGIVIYQGGAIRISGGSIEMRPHATDTSDHFVVRKGAPGGLASAEDVVITGIRSEYHGDNKKLVQSYDDDMYNLKVTFRDSTFSTWRDNPRVVVRAATNTIVQFRSCFLNDAMLFEAVGSSNNDPSGALIMFEACSSGKGAPLHQRSTVVGSNARILANNCYRGSVTRSASPITPEDFDFGWDNGAPQSVTARTKTVALRRMGQRVPNPVDGYTWDLDLPSGAFIERLVVHLPQNSNRDAGTYQLHVGSGDQSIEYGSSGSGLTARDEHRIDLGGVYLNGGSLRVWATGAANQTGNGGTGVLAYMTYL